MPSKRPLSLEECKEHAIVYRNRTEWKSGHYYSYNTSIKNDWIEECMPIRMNSKYDTTYIRSYFEKYGMLIVGEFEYLKTHNSTDYVKYWCIAGKHYNTKQIKEMLYGSKGCGKCNSITTNKVIERFSKCGLKVIDGFEYCTGEPIKYWCESGGHYYETKWDLFKDRCGKCNKNPEYDTASVKLMLEGYNLKVYDVTWEYTHNKAGIPLECERGHRTDTITLNNLRAIKCNGCKTCSIAYKNIERFHYTSNLRLYCVLLKFSNIECIKFGITSYSIVDRFKKDSLKYNFSYDILLDHIGSTEDICYLEVDLLDRLSCKRCKDLPIGFGGYSECYSISVEEALLICETIK